MLEKAKLEKIKSFNNDDSDLVLVFDKYIEREIPYSNENVYGELDKLIENLEKECLYIVFSNKNIEIENAYTVKIKTTEEKILEEDLYYTGKRYHDKLKSFSVDNELINELPKYNEVKFIFDIESISTFPIWETKMRRKITQVLEDINFLSEELTPEKFAEIVHSTKTKEIENKQLYDLDLVIKYILEISKLKNVQAIFLSEANECCEKFIIEELKKVVFAANLPLKERNDYIYNTTYKDMNEMFSRFNFCNFKENKCLSQRHKNLSNKYPKPKTDGCCFKVFGKCKYNNKDGTCQIECLPCKIFTCPYLSKLGVGLRISELILMRAFMNSKQKRLLIYNFYKPKEFFIKRMS